jgi:N-acetylmuramoyl-L-alanine amidase
VQLIHRKSGTLLLCAALLWGGAARPSADTPRQAYLRVLSQERTLRLASTRPSLADIRAAIQAYEAIARRYPASPYTDNALWQAANLSVLAHQRFAQPQDRQRALRLVDQLRTHFPSSSLAGRLDEITRELEVAPAAGPVTFVTPAPVPDLPIVGSTPVAVPPSPSATAASTAAPGTTVSLRDIKRTPLPDGMRVTMELDGEAEYRSERLERPRRVFFDLKNVRAVSALQDATLKFTDAAVREIRLGRHPNTTRVVIDMEGLDTYSVFTLYEPFRVVIDFQKAAPIAAVKPELPPPAPVAPPTPPAVSPKYTDAPIPPMTPPSPPSANSNGQFSLARQLGLGVSRIVIDAGHGGHDPGARANGIVEAELVLDVATRVAKLLQKQPGFEVVMTRDRDVFIPLEERTAIANREGADLFLSVHANASRNIRARGVETYFLNFASNPEAEAVAARENSGSAKTMHNLPEIVKAIALNNKIDESRDLAGIVQKSMMRRLGQRNRQLKDLGVKQAPFVVLIGAGMPSVLAEISFVTHRQESQLLKTAAYRQQIAEALFDGIVKYQQSLKKPRAIATRQP